MLNTKVLLLLLHMFITWARLRRPPASADDVTRVPDNEPETQALLGDGHVIRRYSDDERLDGGRQGDDDVTAPHNTSVAVS